MRIWWSGLRQIDLFPGTSHLWKMFCRTEFWQATCASPVCWRGSGRLQSSHRAEARAAVPPDGARLGSFPLVRWQIAQLWCYMSALAVRISGDKPGMFCMPDSGAEPLHWDNLLEGTVGPEKTRVGNPLTFWPACNHRQSMQRGQLYSWKKRSLAKVCQIHVAFAT